MKTIKKPCINSNCRNGEEEIGDQAIPKTIICRDCGGKGYIEYTKAAIKSVIADLINEINDLEEEYEAWEKLLKEFK